MANTIFLPKFPPSLSLLSINTKPGTSPAMVSLLAPRWYPVMYTLNRCHRDRFGTNLGPARQVPRFQVTDTPEVLNAATTPKPEPPTLFYTRTELALPVCGSGTDLKKTDQKRT